MKKLVMELLLMREYFYVGRDDRLCRFEVILCFIRCNVEIILYVVDGFVFYMILILDVMLFRLLFFIEL